MTTIVVSTMQDAHVRSSASGVNYGSGTWVRLITGSRLGLILPQLAGVRGRTVLSATLSGHVGPGWVAQTLTGKPITQSWSAGTVTWDNRPAVSASNNATLVTGVLADGAQIDMNVLSMIQAMAAGAAWNGLQLSTSTATEAFLYSNDSGSPAWTLTIELSDAPDQPADLHPSQGAVGSASPILAWSFTDLGGDSTEQGRLRVQVDAAANGTTPAFDTGWPASTDPQYDLSGSTAVTINRTISSPTITAATAMFDTVADVGATITGTGIPAGTRLTAVASTTSATMSANATASATGAAAVIRGFTALSSGASTQWRVAVKDAAGLQSAWSDWATFSYSPKPTLTVDSPTGGVIHDPTFNIAAHITGETLTQWKVRVTSGTDQTDVLYGTGLRDGAFSLTLPEKNSDGRRIIKDHTASYWVNFRAWGSVDRAYAVGDTSYVEQWVSITFTSGATTAPDTFGVAAAAVGDPRTTFTWHLAAAPDAVVIFAGNDVYARLTSTEWTSLGSGNYSFTDDGLLQPYQSTAFTIRAIAGGVRSPASSTVNYTSKPVGVWLIRHNVSPVAMSGIVSVSSFENLDRVATYKPLNVTTDVSIFYGFEGVSGRFEGAVSETTTQGALAAVSRLKGMRKAVTERPRLIWATQSIPVQLRNLSALPASEFRSDSLLHDVRFDFIQDGD